MQEHPNNKALVNLFELTIGLNAVYIYAKRGLMLCDEELKNLTLVEIENLLQRNQRSLRDYPQCHTQMDISHTNSIFFSNLLQNFCVIKLFIYILIYYISDEQCKIFKIIMEAVNQELGRMFFLYGYGGTEKTHMWRTLTYALRSEKQIVLTVASSGIASLLLPGGRKTHSKFKIPVPSIENSICNIHQGSELAGLLKQTKLIIWDEALMSHKMSMSPSQTQWPFKLIRRQFPIIVSYAMTINKSQGQSLESVGLYLPKPVFSHDQLYVVISRIPIHDKDGNPLKSTTNVVYKEVFQNL
ncbi:hypothetical protein Lal_00018161 [Lupinus albus]|nr:hypothetical protein Lal_00018161 [Lupinus albus]